MPSAKEIETKGQNLGEINSKLLKNVEELTLYLIEKDKQLKEEINRNKIQESQLISQQKAIDLILEKVKRLEKQDH
ncbi:hypothetical protein [Pedobacter sp. L105]|uniref:hypothetical protein n=1 Tax=Pedobacter sp. L105 TaxID=1641871 RepID=UPI00131C71E7|nr:hypothetical protein [Pedobacter sp. L105]